MFYSDVLLTKGKGSLGIFWLAATLGGQKQNRKITRKAITAVDFAKACELIAEPPEPLALRLSGNLLVGVARVYHQSYDFFYADVNYFHSTLRRSLLTEFGASESGGDKTVGLDLPAGGRSKIDTITLGGTDIAWETGLDYFFTPIDWRNPLASGRIRRSTSKLDSLQSQSQQEEEEYESEEESDEESEPGQGRRKRATYTPDILGSQNTLTRINLPQRSSLQRTPEFGIDQAFNNFEELDLGLDFSGMGNDFDPSSGPSRPLNYGDGDMSAEAQDLQIQDDPFFLPDDQDPSGIITPQQKDGNVMTSAQKRRRRLAGEESEEEEEQVEAVLGKIKKIKKLKTLRFDDDIELSNEEDYSARERYTQMMDRERREIRAKEDEKRVAAMATSMVDGAGNWVQFFHPEMKAFFATLTKCGEWKWELAVAAHKKGKNGRLDVDTAGAQQDHYMGQDQVDPFGGGYDNMQQDYQEQYQDYQVPLREERGRFSEDLEMGRRESQQSHKSGHTPLPWDDISFEGGAFGPDSSFSGGKRFSTMTPQESRIRLSSRLGSSGQATHSARRRERSNSVLAPNGTVGVPMLHGDDLELPEYNELKIDPEMEEGNSAFAPKMLATLETQCRDFLSYVEMKMVRGKKSQIGFEDIAPPRVGKRIASTAFYNCLTLATKRMFILTQDDLWTDFSIKLNIDV